MTTDTDTTSLHNFFVSLIAKQAGIPEKGVTEDWIIEQRQCVIYPNARWHIDSNHRTLKFLTRQEILDIFAVTDSLLTTHLRRVNAMKKVRMPTYKELLRKYARTLNSPALQGILRWYKHRNFR